ncbi:MAG TPA: glutamine-hydrolyzing carbamoyl-phosphate synthase small subunit [Gaiellaceae bacterium]|nr:glutamine-hydrolyzing carbamoyl-phosphate synthase small subunit [Gaiellaceae bacterium]
MRKMQDGMHAHLVLEDGTLFRGRSVGSPGTAAGEICFTTAMAGYEEAVTDPSYAGQVLVFSYPLVGNYGTDPSRRESSRAQTRGVVMRRVRPAWAAWLADEGVPALDDVDTRALVRRIRTEGAMRCALGTAEPDELRRLALSEPSLAGQTLAAEAGTPVPFRFGSGPRVVVLDLGCKRSILRRLAESGLQAVVVPPTTPADEILALDPAAVLVSNGPGDPAAAADQVETVAALVGRVRLFGICLGHQLVALALGMRTFKLPFGHRGANHPVRERGSSRVLVTTQNHGYAVEASDAAEVSHLSLNDATVEGLESEDVTTLQFHPEAAPGPLDALPFFDRIAAACRSAPTFAAS